MPIALLRRITKKVFKKTNERIKEIDDELGRLYLLKAQKQSLPPRPPGETADIDKKIKNLESEKQLLMS